MADKEVENLHHSELSVMKLFQADYWCEDIFRSKTDATLWERFVGIQI